MAPVQHFSNPVLRETQKVIKKGPIKGPPIAITDIVILLKSPVQLAGVSKRTRFH